MVLKTALMVDENGKRVSENPHVLQSRCSAWWLYEYWREWKRTTPILSGCWGWTGVEQQTSRLDCLARKRERLSIKYRCGLGESTTLWPCLLIFHFYTHLIEVGLLFLPKHRVYTFRSTKPFSQWRLFKTFHIDFSSIAVMDVSIQTLTSVVIIRRVPFRF